MKKKKRNFIIKIFSLLLLGIISVTLLGSWTYNPSTDTITSDNICSAYTNVTKTVTKNGITCSMNNGVFTFNGTCTSQINEGINYFMQIPSESLTLESGTYYYTGFINQQKFNFIFEYPNYKFSWNTSLISNQVNISSTTNFYDLFHIFISVNDTFDNVVIKPMISINPITSWEPYGQTYVNQQRLDDLELEYDDLAEQYSNLYDDYETLQSNYSALQQDLVDMTELKEYYENKYTETYNDYNALQQQYEDLLLRYSNLQSQNEILQNEINILKEQNKDLYNSIYGYDYFTNSNCSIIQTYANDFYNNTIGSGSNLYHSWYLNTFNINDFIVDNRISAYSLANSIYQDNKNGVSSGGVVTPWGNNLFTSLTLYPSYNIGSSVTSNYYYAKDFNIAIHFDNLSNVNVRILLAQNTTDIINSNYNYIRFDIDDIVDNSINILFDENSTFYNYLVVAVEIQYVYDSNTDSYNGSDYIYSNGLTGEVNTAYQLGYDTGYGTASSIYSANIYNLNTEINSLNTTISYLRNEISTLQDRLADNLGWRPLFFAMADTPIEVVSKVLGFELFGINLFQAFIGIVTALAIIWLIRKIWK